MRASVSFLQTKLVFVFLLFLSGLSLTPVLGQANVTQVSLEAYRSDDLNTPLRSNSVVQPGDSVVLILNATPVPQRAIAPNLFCELVARSGEKRTIVSGTKSFTQPRQVTVNIDPRSGSGEVICEVSVGTDASAGYVIGTPRHSFLVEAKPAVSITPYGRVKEGKDPARFLIEVVDIIPGISVDVGYSCTRSGTRVFEALGQNAPTFTDTDTGRRQTVAVPVRESDGDGDVVCTIEDRNAYRLVRGSAAVAVDEDVPIVSIDSKDGVSQINERDARVVFSAQLSKPAPRQGLTINLSCQESGFSGDIPDIPLSDRIVRPGNRSVSFPVNFSGVHVAGDRSSASITCSLKKSALYDRDSQKTSKRVQVQAKPLVSLKTLPGVTSVYTGSEAIFELVGAYLTGSLRVSVSCFQGTSAINIGSIPLLSIQNPSRFIPIPTHQLDERPITCRIDDDPEYKWEAGEHEATIRVLGASGIPEVSIEPEVTPVMQVAGGNPASGGSASVAFIVRATSSAAVGEDTVSVALFCGLNTRGTAGERALQRREVVSVPINDSDGHRVSISLSQLPFRGSYVYCRLGDYQDTKIGSLFELSATQNDAEVQVNPLPAVSLSTNQSGSVSVNDIIEVQLWSHYTEGLTAPVQIPWDCSFPRNDIRVSRIAVSGQTQVGSYGGTATVTNTPGLQVVGRFLVTALGSSSNRGSVTCSLGSPSSADIVLRDDTFSLATPAAPILSLRAIVNGPVYTDGIARFFVQASRAPDTDLSARVTCRYSGGGGVQTSLSGADDLLSLPTGSRLADFSADLRLGPQGQGQLICTLLPGTGYAVGEREVRVALVQPTNRPIVSITARKPVIGKVGNRFENAVFLVSGERIPSGGLSIGLRCQTQDVYVGDFQKIVDQSVDLSAGDSSVARIIEVTRLHHNPGYVGCSVRPSETRQYDVRGSLSEAKVKVEYADGVCGPTGYTCEQGTWYWVSGYYGPQTAALKCLGIGGGIDSAVCLDDVPRPTLPTDPTPVVPPTGADPCPVPSSVTLVERLPSLSDSGDSRTLRFDVRADLSGLQLSGRCLYTNVPLYCKTVGSEENVFPSGSSGRSHTGFSTSLSGSGVVTTTVAVPIVKENAQPVTVECGTDSGSILSFAIPATGITVEPDPNESACVDFSQVGGFESAWASRSLCRNGWTVNAGNATQQGNDVVFTWRCHDPARNGAVENCEHVKESSTPIVLRGNLKEGINIQSIDDTTSLTLTSSETAGVTVFAALENGESEEDTKVYPIGDIRIRCYYEKTNASAREEVQETFTPVTIPAGNPVSNQIAFTVVGSDHQQGTDLTCRIDGGTASLYTPVGGDFVIPINGGKRELGEFEQCWILFFDEDGARGVPRDREGNIIHPPISEDGSCYRYVQRCGREGFYGIERHKIGMTETIRECFTIDQIRKMAAYVKSEGGSLTCEGGGKSFQLSQTSNAVNMIGVPDGLIGGYFSISHPDYQSSMSCKEFRKEYAGERVGDFDDKNDGKDEAYPYIDQLPGFTFTLHTGIRNTVKAMFDRVQSNALQNPFMHTFVEELGDENIEVANSRVEDEKCVFRHSANRRTITLDINKGPDNNTTFSCKHDALKDLEYQEGGFTFPAPIAYFTDYKGDTVGGIGDGQGYALEDLVVAVSFVEKDRFPINDLRIKCYDKTNPRNLKQIFDSTYSEGRFQARPFVTHSATGGVRRPLAFLKMYTDRGYLGEMIQDIGSDALSTRRAYYRYAEVIDSVMYDSLNRMGFVELYLKAGTSDDRFGYYRYNTKDSSRHEVPYIFASFLNLHKPKPVRNRSVTTAFFEDYVSEDGTKYGYYRQTGSGRDRKRTFQAYPDPTFLFHTRASIIGQITLLTNYMTREEQQFVGREMFNRTNAVIVTIPRSRFNDDAKYVRGSAPIQCSLIPNGYHVYEEYDQGMYANIHFNLGPTTSPGQSDPATPPPTGGLQPPNQQDCPLDDTVRYAFDINDPVDPNKVIDCCDVLFGNAEDPNDMCGKLESEIDPADRAPTQQPPTGTNTSGNDTSPPVITIAKPYDVRSGRFWKRGLYATDDDRGTTRWKYVVVAQSKTSCVQSDFVSAKTYNEASGLTFDPKTDSNSKICFRSTDSSGNHGYGISVLIGNVGDESLSVNCPNWLVTLNSENGVDCCRAYQEADHNADQYRDTDPSSDDTECVKMICDSFKEDSQNSFTSQLESNYWCST